MSTADTPMMRQWRQAKQQCGDAILMIRIGDFYEMFGEDARIGAQVLDIALTKKSVGKGESMPLAGVPWHAVQDYIYRLTRAGHRVAVCDQLEEARPGKLVKRAITRTVTPGTSGLSAAGADVPTPLVVVLALLAAGGLAFAATRIRSRVADRRGA